MGKGKFKGKPPGRRPGHRNFSTPQQMRIALKNATRPPTFKQELAKTKESEEEKVTEGSERKGVQGLIEIEKLNIGRSTELSRRERKEIEKQEAHERYMRLCEQGKTEESKKDLERLALLRAQREEAAREREEEKAAQERMKTERAARSQKLATEQNK